MYPSQPTLASNGLRSVPEALMLKFTEKLLCWEWQSCRIRWSGVQGWRGAGEGQVCLLHNFPFPFTRESPYTRVPSKPSEVKACLWASYCNHWPIAINQRHVFILHDSLELPLLLVFFTDVGWGEGKVLTLLTQDGKHGNENNALKHQRWPGMIVRPWSNSLNGLLSMTLGVIQVIPWTRPWWD